MFDADLGLHAEGRGLDGNAKAQIVLDVHHLESGDGWGGGHRADWSDDVVGRITVTN
jgi:hypothetical protein